MSAIRGRYSRRSSASDTAGEERGMAQEARRQEHPTRRIAQIIPATPGWRVVYTGPTTGGQQAVAQVAAWALCEDATGEQEVIGLISAGNGRLGLVTDVADPATAAPGVIYLGPDEAEP
jgi:hypothetical protein